MSFDYVADVYTSGAGSDAGSRVLRVKRTSSACADEYSALKFDYRIKPVVGKVKCANVAGTPDVGAYAYSFTLLPDCESGLRAYYDTTGDQRLTTDDLTGWFASPRDYDRNGAADTADLVRLMQAVVGSPD